MSDIDDQIFRHGRDRRDDRDDDRMLDLDMNQGITMKHLNDHASAIQAVIVGTDDDSIDEMQRMIDEEPSPVIRQPLLQFANVRIRRCASTMKCSKPH